jgi:single-strand DNA-binding protein
MPVCLQLRIYNIQKLVGHPLYKKKGKLMSTNVWVGIGNLGDDPTLRQSASGTDVCNFNIAVDSRPDRDGNRQPNWIPVTVWGIQATTCAKYLMKGSKVCVSGQLRVRNWEDREGVRHRGFEIRGTQVDFLSGIRSSHHTPSAPVVTASPQL